MNCCPNRLCFRELRMHGAGGVVHHVHQAAFSGALFQPAMKAAVQLHQFAEMRLALPSLAIGLAPALSPPQPCFPHPAPQALGSNLEPVVAGQMLTRQRRTKICITLPHPIQHCLAKLPRVSPVRSSPAVPMLQSPRPAPAIPRPYPLGLPIAQLQQLCRFLQPQAARLYPCHHFDPT